MESVGQCWTMLDIEVPFLRSSASEIFADLGKVRLIGSGAIMKQACGVQICHFHCFQEKGLQHLAAQLFTNFTGHGRHRHPS